MTYKMKVSDIIINSEYEKAVPPLTDKEYWDLFISIKENGVWTPLTVNSQRVLLDGHHRYKSCKEQGISEVETITKDFPSPLHEKLFVIQTNRKRRQLTAAQNVDLAFKETEIESLIEQAQINFEAKNPQKGEKGFQPILSRNLEKIGEKRGVIDIVAKKTGLSHDTVSKVKKIMDSAPEELKEKVRSGKTSINYAYKQITRAEEHKETPKLPDGQYDVIYADPPWHYEFSVGHGTSEAHYQVMTDDELKELQIPAAKDAMLFLWVTNPKLEVGLSVLKKWGFEYKTMMTWVKDGIGTGHYIRARTEHILIGKKGDIPLPQEHTRPDSVLTDEEGNIIIKKSRHSEKPELVYNIIEEMYPNRTYLELFARSRYNEKWTVWGLEAPPPTPIPIPIPSPAPSTSQDGATL